MHIFFLLGNLTIVYYNFHLFPYLEENELGMVFVSCPDMESGHVRLTIVTLIYLVRFNHRHIPPAPDFTLYALVHMRKRGHTVVCCVCVCVCLSVTGISAP